jgi:hypothetical protein
MVFPHEVVQELNATAARELAIRVALWVCGPGVLLQDRQQIVVHDDMPYHLLVLAAATPSHW